MRQFYNKFKGEYNMWKIYNIDKTNLYLSSISPLISIRVWICINNRIIIKYPLTDNISIYGLDTYPLTWLHYYFLDLNQTLNIIYVRE